MKNSRGATLNNSRCGLIAVTRSVDLYLFLLFFVRISKSSLQWSQWRRSRPRSYAVLHIILTGRAFRSPWWKFQSASHSCLSAVINHNSFISADWLSQIQSRLGPFSRRKKPEPIRFYKNIDKKYSWQSTTAGCCVWQMLDSVQWHHGTRSSSWWRMLSRAVSWSGQTTTCSSLSLFSFNIKAEILAYSKSFEAHHPGSVKLRVSARTPPKQRSLFKGVHLIFFQICLGSWASEDQDVWKFGKCEKRSEVSTAGLKDACTFTERNKISILRSIYPLRVAERGYPIAVNVTCTFDLQPRLDLFMVQF